MSENINYDEWLHLGENDPPADLSREEATYEREKERLMRDQFGKVAVIHKDEIVGIWDTVDEAIYEAVRQRGRVRLIVRLITDEYDKVEWVSMVDINHPSIKRID